VSDPSALGGLPLLSARDLEVGYAGGFALRVPALELRPGEVLAVLGPNGSGKSTLLRALAGLLPPREGALEVRAARGVSLVFQRPVLLRGGVAWNAELPLWGRGVARRERRRRAAAALERLGLSALAGRDAATLSGGEARRLALARAFAVEPDVLLLDEPFDDLDAIARERLSLDLRRAIGATGIAVALVTHELRQALLLADRIAVLRPGALVQLGPRDEVLRRPATPEIAELVGMANLLAGSIGERDLRSGLARIALEAGGELRAPSALSRGTGVIAGIRPENVKIDEAGDDPGRVGSGVVCELVSDGAIVTAWIEWQGVRLRSHLLAGRGLGHALKSGDRVHIAIRPEDVHVMPRPR